MGGIYNTLVQLRRYTIQIEWTYKYKITKLTTYMHVVLARVHFDPTAFPTNLNLFRASATSGNNI